MIIRFERVALVFLLIFLGARISFSQTQEPVGSIEAVQVTGLTDIKRNTKGTLKIENGSLSFMSSKASCNVSAAAIQDVVTGNDSQRAVGGTVGTLTMFAPYGAGRALSLFRNKIDVITIEYRDADGGLHGTIFTLPVGKAQVIKQELLDQGAHTSAASGETSSPDSDQRSEAKEPRR